MKRKEIFFEYLCLFVFALTIRLAYNFGSGPQEDILACDAYEYVKNAQEILQIFGSFFSNLSFGNLSPSTSLEAFSFVEKISQSGPIFPLFLAFCGQLGGVPQDLLSHPSPLQIGNCVASAFTVVLIAAITNTVDGRITARIAGMLAATYPSFVINSGRLYSETFAAMLLSCMLLLLLEGFRLENKSSSNKKLFWIGCLAAALQFTRSLMILWTIGVIGILSWQRINNGSGDETRKLSDSLKNARAWLKFFLPFVLGFCSIALPWLCFEHSVLHKMDVVLDRQAHYNFFIGNRVDTQGWLSYPFPDGSVIKAKSLPELAWDEIAANPSGWLALITEKPVRMYKFPWNDFRRDFWLITFPWQVLIHQWLILFALTGFFKCTTDKLSDLQSERRWRSAVIVFSVILIHFGYFAFITVPRYNLGAMTAILTFSACGISWIASAIAERQSRLRTLAFLFCVLLLPVFLDLRLTNFLMWVSNDAQFCLRLENLLKLTMAIFSLYLGFGAYRERKTVRSEMALTGLVALAAIYCTLPMRVNGRTFEWSSSLSGSRLIKGETNSSVQDKTGFTQTVFVPLSRLPTQKDFSLYVLVDLNNVRQFAQGWTLSVNGQKVQGPILPSLYFAQRFPRYQKLEDNSFRDEGEFVWYSLARASKRDLVDMRQWSVIEIPANLSKIARDNARARGESKVHFDFTVNNESLNDFRIFGSYDSLQQELAVPSPYIYSWEKSYYGVEDSRDFCDPRYDFKLSKSSHSLESNDCSENIGIQKGFFNLVVLIPKEKNDLSKIVIPLKEQRNKSGNLEYLAIVPETAEAHSIVISIKGNSTTDSSLKDLQTDCTAFYTDIAGKEFSFKSVWTPAKLHTSSTAGNFCIVSPLPGTINDCQLKNVRVAISPTDKSSAKTFFKDTCCEVYLLPRNPILDSVLF